LTHKHLNSYSGIRVVSTKLAPTLTLSTRQEQPIQPYSTAARSLALAGYPIALLLIVVPMLNALPQLVPASIGSAEWRYGAVGIVVGNVVTPILGLSIASAAALVARQRVVLKVISLAFLVLALGLVLGGIAFLAGVGAVAAHIGENMAAAFRAATARTVVIGLLAAVASGWLGVGGWRAARSASVP